MAQADGCHQEHYLDMVYLSDLNRLMHAWTERLDNPVLPQSYKDAVNDCLFELNRLVSGALEEELDAYEPLKEVRSDAA